MEVESCRLYEDLIANLRLNQNQGILNLLLLYHLVLCNIDYLRADSALFIDRKNLRLLQMQDNTGEKKRRRKKKKNSTKFSSTGIPIKKQKQKNLRQHIHATAPFLLSVRFADVFGGDSLSIQKRIPFSPILLRSFATMIIEHY